MCNVSLYMFKLILSSLLSVLVMLNSKSICSVQLVKGFLYIASLSASLLFFYFYIYQKKTSQP